MKTPRKRAAGSAKSTPASKRKNTKKEESDDDTMVMDTPTKKGRLNKTMGGRVAKTPGSARSVAQNKSYAESESEVEGDMASIIKNEDTMNDYAVHAGSNGNANSFYSSGSSYGTTSYQSAYNGNDQLTQDNADNNDIYLDEDDQVEA